MAPEAWAVVTALPTAQAIVVTMVHTSVPEPNAAATSPDPFNVQVSMRTTPHAANGNRKYAAATVTITVTTPTPANRAVRIATSVDCHENIQNTLRQQRDAGSEFE